MKRLFARTLLVVVVLLLAESAGFCATYYVTDTFKIVLRSGPGTEYRIISLLPSGKPVEVLSQEGEWTQVRVRLKGDKVVEGWVLTRYLIERLPWKIQALTLREENLTLKEELGSLKKRLEELQKRQRELETLIEKQKASYQKLKKEYDSLRQGAKGYLALKKEYEALRAEAEANRVEVERLRAENKRLKASERNKWFAIGAVVVLCGIMIGYIMGRRQKKRKSYIY